MRRATDRWTQISLLIGGVLWAVVWAHRASLPVPGPDQTKPGGEIFDLRVVASLALIAVGMAGVQSVRTRHTGRLGNLGISLISVGVALMAIWVTELLDVYSLFVLGGMTILVGTILFAVVALRTKALSAATTVPLIATSLLFLAVNPDNRQAYLAVPLGVAWVWLATSERRARMSGTSLPSAKD